MNERQLDYPFLRDTLRWSCKGDHIFLDGADHYQIDRGRFEQAVETMGSLLNNSTIYDIGSFPGYGIWAFRNCRRYIGVGKCPDWFRSAIGSVGQLDWVDWEIESSSVPLAPPDPPDLFILQEVLEHIRLPKRFLTNLRTIMPDGAHLYLTTNNLHYLGYILKMAAGREVFDSAMTEGAVYPGHTTYYTLDGLKAFLTEIGFQIVKARRVNFLPPAQYYRRRFAAQLKNIMVKCTPNLYHTHLEVLCRKCDENCLPKQ